MGHDEKLWRCMWVSLRVPSDAGVLARDTASLPLALGGLGLRNAVRSRQSAHWASWADTLPCLGFRGSVGDRSHFGSRHFGSSVLGKCVFLLLRRWHFSEDLSRAVW